jgi:teichoic acid transport system permease protein
MVISQSGEIKKSFSEIMPLYKLVICFAVSILITLILYKYIEIGESVRLIKTFASERKLIGKLTLNDFKTKYSGSYFGIVWAVVQPLCQIAVYWFVFQIGLRSSAVDDVPFILWFMAGLVPWFFFSEAWGSATNVFSEYSYLVKKIVFKTDILPLIKVLSAVFIHLFFAVFMIVVFIVYGRTDIRMLGIVYYSFAMIVFTTALSL